MVKELMRSIRQSYRDYPGSVPLGIIIGAFAGVAGWATTKTLSPEGISYLKTLEPAFQGVTPAVVPALEILATAFLGVASLSAAGYPLVRGVKDHFGMN